jgi:hypothetical protein
MISQDADKFTIEVNTIVNIIINNFDSEEIELLNQEEVKIKIRKQPKSTSHAAYACVIYEITDSKKNIENFNPLHYPQTIIDISVGILRIYKSLGPKIEYIVNDVNYSPPRFLQTEIMGRNYSKE